MTKHVTYKEIMERRLCNLEHLLNFIKLQDRTSAEIELELKKTDPKLSRSSLFLYRKELERLKLIEFDISKDIWSIVGKKKRQYNAQDYKLAIQHARKLLAEFKEIIDEPVSGVPDELPISRYSSLLIFLPEDHPFIQHIKEGYFIEIFRPVEKLRELLSEERCGSPKVSAQRASDQKWKLTKQVLNEAAELDYQITQEIWRIEGQAYHGIPLRGRCDYCPSESLLVKDVEL